MPRLPAFPSSTSRSGGSAAPAGPDEDVSDELGQGHGPVVCPRGTAQEQDRVAHLFALEEAFPATDEVGHLGVGEGGLDGFALRVGPKEHSNLGGGRPAGHQSADFRSDPARLVRIIVIADERRSGAIIPLGAQDHAAAAPSPSGRGLAPVKE